MNQTTQETKRIEAYAIADFVKQIQEAVLEGYKINLEDNEKYPLQIGVGFYCTVDKDGPITTKETIYDGSSELEKEFVSNSPQPNKRGRQPKV